MKKLSKSFLILTAIFLLLSVNCYSDDGKPHLNRGLQAYQAADFDRTISELDEAIRLGLSDKDDLIKAYLYLGFAYIAKNQRLHAEVEFGKAIKLEPTLNLDPKIYSSKIISVFNYVRERLIDNITVLSDPGEADVFIDEKKVGVTPLRLDNILTGNHILTVVKEFYQSKSLEIEVVKGFENRFQIDLEKKEVSLLIDSQPTGASVYMAAKDGYEDMPQGTTPHTINLVLDQEKSIKLTKAEFLDKAINIKLTYEGFKISDLADLVQIKNDIGNITIKLDLAPPPGILKITADPLGAIVYIDGISVGESPITINATPGTRNIRVSALGFPSVVRKIEIFSDKESLIHAMLGGTLFITSIPDKAQVFINNEYKGVTPYKTDTIPAGTYQIRLAKDKYRDNVSTVIVEREQEKELNIRLQSLKGSIAVSSEPSGANVFIDGQLRGKTPILIYGVTVGQHLLRLVEQNHEVWQKQINVEEHKITWQFGNLAKKQEF